MTIKTPLLWGAENYYRFIGVESAGRMAATHLAQLIGPDGKVHRAYVKHYPPELQRGLFNEWLAYIMFSALGVPQPQAAMMPAPTIDQGRPTNRMQWAFCSFEPTPRFDGIAKKTYNIGDPDQVKALIKRLFLDCWHQLPILIAADQLLIHPDRNIGNIAFTGKKSFVAIDGGGILGGEHVHPWELYKHQGWAESKLIEALIPIETLSPTQKNTLIAAAQCVEEQFFKHHQEIAQAINYRKHRDVDVCFDAIWWRALEIEAMFRKKLGVLL